MIDLSNVTFIIPLRIDSDDRLRNIILSTSFLLSKFENPTVKFSGFTVLLNALTAAQQEVVAGLEIGDLVSVSKTFNVGSPSTVSQNVVVESIRHSINPQRHDVTVGLGQIRLAFVLNTSDLDNPDYGLQ